MDSFFTAQWFGIALVIFIMGMSKGGFPISGITLPLLVLLWPEQGEAARSAVSFMLPLLCTMDLAGALMYRGHIAWHHIRKLTPGMLLGIVVASVFFVSEQGLAVSDQVLKIVIGLVGLFFSGSHFFAKKISFNNTPYRPLSFGFGAGFTSTIAHAAGPVMQMYLLPCHLEKKVFAGTTVYFFLLLNLLKLIPFTLLGRFSAPQLLLDLKFLPIIPIGVLTGYFLVAVMKETQYILFIRLSLAITSLLLIIKALF